MSDDEFVSIIYTDRFKKEFLKEFDDECMEMVGFIKDLDENNVKEFILNAGKFLIGMGKGYVSLYVDMDDVEEHVKNLKRSRNCVLMKF